MMDTSKEYIKMCDCREIQSKWEIGVDAMMHPATDSHDYAQMILKPHPKYKTQKACITIWLPRQDQIQEMLQPIKLYELLDICGEGMGIMWKVICEYADSFEQLWLAYYMSEKHHKIWDGKKWIKSE